jgi:hypothetical protein
MRRWIVRPTTTVAFLVCSTLLLPAVACVRSAHAQASAEYRIRVGDTLRYAERTDSRFRFETPAGQAELNSEHIATIAVTPSRDTMLAWYESLLLRQQGPGPERQEPNTEALLRQPFRLSISPRGVVKVLAFPSILREVASVTDLTRQFNDFFVTLPAQPLVAGATWTDTSTDTRPTKPRNKFSSRHVRSYQVERDTVVLGVAAVVIRLDQQLRMQMSSPMEDREGTVESMLEGTEEGIAIFAPSTGTLLGRRRAGFLRGTYSMLVGSARSQIPQRYEYTSTLSLVP